MRDEIVHPFGKAARPLFRYGDSLEPIFRGKLSSPFPLEDSMDEQRKSPHSKLDWSANFTRESLVLLCDVQGQHIEALNLDKLVFEDEIRGIIEAARRAFPFRHTDNGAGLRQLIRAVRQMKERCEARTLAAQAKRSQESMQEIEAFRARRASGNLT